jgi:hypothetical protein
MPRDSRIAAREAAAIPFPRLETTPPVTKTYFVMYAEQGVKAEVYTPSTRISNSNWIHNTPMHMALGLDLSPCTPARPERRRNE